MRMTGRINNDDAKTLNQNESRTPELIEAYMYAFIIMCA